VARDDLFRRSFEAGTGFIDMSRERAEAFVKDLVKQGDLRKKKAQKAVDDLVERSRQATDELRNLIGREIGEQLKAMGVATKDDISQLERRIDELVATQRAAAQPAPPAGADASGGGDPLVDGAQTGDPRGGAGAAATTASGAGKRRAGKPRAGGADAASGAGKTGAGEPLGGEPLAGSTEGG
jgi:polyhydroxyalkanoate synthesis regulator phasin